MLIRNILVDLQNGSYLIPEVQRGFVWKNHQIAEFLNSIYNSYPVGSIIIWEITPISFRDEYKGIFSPLIDGLEIKNGKYMVIDGQQRLISLLLAKRGKITKSGKDRKINIYFKINIGNQKGEFVNPRSSELKDNFFNITDLLSDEDIDSIIEKNQIKDNDSRKKAFMSILSKAREKLLTYDLPIINIDKSVFEEYIKENEENIVGFLEKLSEMFIKLNSQGTRVKMPELVIALLTPISEQIKGEPLRKILNDIDDEISQYGWDVNEAIYMRLLMAISTNLIKFVDFKKEFKKITKEKLAEDLKNMKECLIETIKCLNKLNIRNQNSLLSRYSLVTLAYYVFLRKNLNKSINPNEIKKWLITNAINSRYTGRLESDLYEDIRILNEEKELSSLSNKYPLRNLNYELLNQEIINLHRQIILVLLSDSYDFPHKSERISHLRDVPELTEHHIFPKKFLKDAFPNGIKISDHIIDVEEAYNHVGNITYISRSANSHYNDKNPSQYLTEIPEEFRASHFIPLDKTLYNLNNYQDFIKERIKIITEEANRLLNT